MIVPEGTWYIAGPMTGLPQFNVPLFDRVSETLRSHGIDVVNPAELDTPEMRAAALASKDGDLATLEAASRETWGHVIARDVRIVADDVDGLILLPGWSQSRGAKLEVHVALATGKRFFSWERERLIPEDAAEIAWTLRKFL